MGESFRLATIADREAILALRARCFGDIDAEKMEPRFWDWQMLGNAIAFVAEVEGRVAAHVAFIARTYVVGGAAVPAAMAFDAMTGPEYQGRGLFTRLMAFALDEVKSQFELATALQIRRSSLPPMLRTGWVSRLKVPVLVRPVSLRKVAPERSGEREASPGELASVAGSFFSSDRIYGSRTAEYFSWRYFDNPLWSYDIRARRNEGEVVAFLITRPAILKGFSTLAVVDIAWQPGHAREARALLREAVRRTHAQLAAAFVTTAHPAFSLLLRAGFLPSPYRFRLLLHDLGQPRLPQSRWALMWGDTDHL